VSATTHEAGEQLPEQRFAVTRADLVRYAGASGDRNPIHWSDRVATSVGLPGVIAHGMYTLALAARALDTWAKFTKPVVVPDDDTGVEVVVRGTVTAVSEEGTSVTLEVTCGGEKVLGMPRAVLRG
jgi:acyl dehydratase